MIFMDKKRIFNGLWQPFTQMKNYIKQGKRMIDKADGVYVYDANGTKYLDATSSLWNVQLGHGNAYIHKAIIAQIEKLEYSTLFRATNKSAYDFADILTNLFPEPLNYVFFTSNGSESVETAIKMARQYYNQEQFTGKVKIISLKRAYHGVSYAAMSASGFDDDKEKFVPLPTGFIQIEPPYCYRCAFNKTYPQCGLACAENLEKIIEVEKPETIAAFLIEPVMGFGGVIIPPEGYLQRIKEITKKYGIILIFDEVTTGFGRTGKLFGYEHSNVLPDIICLGKGISTGYIPLGGVIASDFIYDKFYSDDPAMQFNHGSTNAGHPVACAAGKATVEYLLQNDVIKKAQPVMEYLCTRLNELKKYPIVGDVRGIGFMFCIELVDDRETKQSLNPDTMNFLLRAMFMSGVWVHYAGNMLYIMPPLIFEKEHADITMVALHKAIGLSQEKKDIKIINHK